METIMRKIMRGQSLGRPTSDDVSGKWKGREMSKLCGTVMVGLLLVSTAACGGGSSSVAPSAVPGVTSVSGGEGPWPRGPPRRRSRVLTIVEIVLQPDGEFDVLQAAVVKAGLVDLLNGKDQHTVFAPTDLAFVTTLGVADEEAARGRRRAAGRSADQHSGLSRHRRPTDQPLGVGGPVLPDAERGYRATRSPRRASPPPTSRRRTGSST